ncbi:MAG: hypothetical protein JWL63_2321 [Rhodocyclales bacterium]|nr:hypothetical protein [Rhodocyclales bacterium]
MNIVRSLAAVAFITLSGLAAAQPAHPPVTTPHAVVAVRHDNRVIAGDRHELVHSRQDLHRAQRSHEFRHAREIRRQMYRERQALRHSRFHRHHDMRQLHRD